MIDPGKMLHGIQNQSRRGTQKVALGSSNDCAVGKLDSRTSPPLFRRTVACRLDTFTIREIDLGLLEEKRDLVDLRLVSLTMRHIIESGEIAADNFVL